MGEGAGGEMKVHMQQGFVGLTETLTLSKIWGC